MTHDLTECPPAGTRKRDGRHGVASYKRHTPRPGIQTLPEPQPRTGNTNSREHNHPDINKRADYQPKRRTTVQRIRLGEASAALQPPHKAGHPPPRPNKDAPPDLAASTPTLQPQQQRTTASAIQLQGKNGGHRTPPTRHPLHHHLRCQW